MSSSGGGETFVEGLPPYSVKIEQTQKGARVTVHVYENDATNAMLRAVQLYQDTRKKLEQLCEVVAPVEGSK